MTSTPNDLVPKPAIAREFGVSDRTISRWIGDPALSFPIPIRINKRLYFQRPALEAWKSERVRASIAAKAA